MDEKSLVLLHPLSNIEITNCFKYEPRFNVIFSRNNLPGIKYRTYGTYAINLDDKNSKGKHWVSLFIDRNTAVYNYTLILLELNIDSRI